MTNSKKLQMDKDFRGLLLSEFADATLPHGAMGESMREWPPRTFSDL
jgi:hypothetical protein